MELRESDLVDSIGMEHKLHLKKILLARQKLTPLSAAEKSLASSVRREDSATATREEIPDIDTAFSQVPALLKSRVRRCIISLGLRPFVWRAGCRTDSVARFVASFPIQIATVCLCACKTYK